MSGEKRGERRRKGKARGRHRLGRGGGRKKIDR